MQQIATLEKDAFLAIALASGTSISEVAGQAAIDRSTVYRRRFMHKLGPDHIWPDLTHCPIRLERDRDEKCW